MNDIISQKLGIDPIDKATKQEESKATDLELIFDDDIETARLAMKRLLVTGEVALGDLLAIAQQSQHPRAFEVVSTLISTLTSTSKELATISMKKAELKIKSSAGAGMPSGSTDSNGGFNGGTTQLLKLVKQLIKDEQNITDVPFKDK